MLNTNLKQIRKAKGLSQEELAIRCNVVRQTVSKWEKGLSVPDADLLIRLAEVLEEPVATLLGTPAEILPETGIAALVEQLVRINEQLAIKNRRARRVWKVVLAVAISLVVVPLMLLVIGSLLFVSVRVVNTAAAENHTAIVYQAQ